MGFGWRFNHKKSFIQLCATASIVATCSENVVKMEGHAMCDVLCSTMWLQKMLHKYHENWRGEEENVFILRDLQLYNEK